MKKLYYFIGFVLIIFIVGFYLYNKIEDDCFTSIPKRKENIPNLAIWKGSCQEGFWFELVNYDDVNHRYRFKIYNDYDGNLEIDADFYYDLSCISKKVKAASLLESIVTFEENVILLKEKMCDLKAVKDKRIN